MNNRYFVHTQTYLVGDRNMKFPYSHLQYHTKHLYHLSVCLWIYSHAAAYTSPLFPLC